MVRRPDAGALALVACVASACASADSPFEAVGVGAAFASPVLGPSLFLQLDERWSGGLVVDERSGRLGGQVQVNYAREGSRGGYWIVGGGRSVEVPLSVIRGGYGYRWRRGPIRWHLEATLNVPFNATPRRDGFAGLFNALATVFPVGFGVHYVFGER